MKSSLFKQSWFLATLIFLLALTVRLIGVGDRPLDGDEGVVLEAASQPTIAAVIDRAADDVHPPAEHLITHFFLKIVPLSETTARIPPVLFGTLAVLGMYLLARRYTNDYIAAVVGLLAALSPYLTFAAQEQRMYSLLLATTLFTLLCLEEFLATHRPGWLIGFILAGTLAAYTHHLGLIVLAGLGLGLVIRFWKETPMLRKSWRDLWGGFLAIFLLYLPQLPTTLHQLTGRSNDQAVGPAIMGTITGLGNLFYRLGAGRLVLGLEPSPGYLINLLRTEPDQFLTLILAALIPLTLTIWGIFVFYQWVRIKQLRVSLILPITLLLTVLLAAFASTEIGGRAVRTLSILAPFYFIPLGAGVWAAWQKPWWRWLPIVLAGIFLLGLTKQVRVDDQAPGTDRIASYLVGHAHSDDIVLARGAFLTGESFVLRYELEKYPAAPKLEIIDFYGDYQIGNLADLRDRKISDVIGDISQDTHTVWFYDLSYTPDVPTQATAHPLGTDKEGFPLILYEVAPQL